MATEARRYLDNEKLDAARQGHPMRIFLTPGIIDTHCTPGRKRQ